MKANTPLLERAASFRRRAEWMINGADRDRILAMALDFEVQAHQAPHHLKACSAAVVAL
ncbi:hypothetical protein BH10PSE2_BH10PSE2_05040 [soil metagenome]